MDLIEAFSEYSIDISCTCRLWCVNYPCQIRPYSNPQQVKRDRWVFHPRDRLVSYPKFCFSFSLMAGGPPEVHMHECSSILSGTPHCCAFQPHANLPHPRKPSRLVCVSLCQLYGTVCETTKRQCSRLPFAAISHGNTEHMSDKVDSTETGIILTLTDGIRAFRVLKSRHSPRRTERRLSAF